MKSIILAAGKGERLRPLTNDRPKCMVELDGIPIIQYQVESMQRNGIININACVGYMQEMIQVEGISKYFNPHYDKSNMVYTLFCAEEILQGDVLITYGDIIFNDSVLQKLLLSSADISVVIDSNWRQYWDARMDNPLEDAETLKLGQDGNIIEIGQKTTTYEDIQGQYIGMIKISGSALMKVRSYYHSLDKAIFYDGMNYDNMYMTSFLQLIADNLLPLVPVFTENGWMEIDTPTDLLLTHFLKNI